MKQLDLLRHGEPIGGQVLRGTTNHPLSEKGWRQLEQKCRDQQWDVIISSPLDRCYQFAVQLGRQLNIEVITAEDLREFDFGIWENQPMEKVFKEDFDRFKGMWGDPLNFSAPEGESLTAFEARVLKAWFGCLARQEQKQLLVCHGGVIRILLKEILGLPFQNINRIDVPYASISRVQVSEEEPYYYQLMQHA